MAELRPQIVALLADGTPRTLAELRALFSMSDSMVSLIVRELEDEGRVFAQRGRHRKGRSEKYVTLPEFAAQLVLAVSAQPDEDEEFNPHEARTPVDANAIRYAASVFAWGDRP